MKMKLSRVESKEIEKRNIILCYGPRETRRLQEGSSCLSTIVMFRQERNMIACLIVWLKELL